MRRTIHGCGSSTGSRRALDVERLLGVEGRGTAVRAGQHGERLGRQPPPPLPQQRLDPADLRREVVGDEQMLHRRRRQFAGTSAPHRVGRAVARAAAGAPPSTACGAQHRVAVREVARRAQRSRLRDRPAGRRCPARPARCAAANADRGRRCTTGPSGRAASRRRRSSRSSTSTHGRASADERRRVRGARGAPSAGTPSWQSSQP